MFIIKVFIIYSCTQSFVVDYHKYVININAVKLESVNSIKFLRVLNYIMLMQIIFLKQ